MENKKLEMKSFEDLEVWQQGRKLVNAIYQITLNDKLARDYGLCGQLQRAAVSIMSNIAEGFERMHLQEKIQFYNVARGSGAAVGRGSVNRVRTGAFGVTGLRYFPGTTGTDG